MNWALLIVRLGLAGVFLTAGLSKFVDRSGSKDAIRAFGIPERLSAPLGSLLPFVELAVGIALVPLASAVAGAIGAVVLLTAFCIGIVAAMLRGEAPNCHCFGQLHSSPAGWNTLLRNIILVAAASFVVAEGLHDPGASAVAWLGQLDGAEFAGLVAGIVVGCAIAGLGWFSLKLLQQNGRMLLRIDELETALLAPDAARPAAQFEWERRSHGLPLGSVAPEFELTSVGGGKRTLYSLLADGRPAMLVFADPGCGPCQALMPELSRWQREYADRLTIAMISRGELDANRAKADEQRVQNILIQADREVSTAYQAHGTPSAILVSAESTIASVVAPGAVAIGQLLDRHLGLPSTGIPLRASPPPANASRFGTEMPELTLSDLKGNDHELSSLKGRHSLVLFWNPGCGFCQKMLPDLKAWEADPPSGAPELVVISAGEPEVVAQMGLSSTVLLDPDGAAMAAFGVHGTPMGVLIGPDFRIASPAVAGAQAVLSLAASLADSAGPDTPMTADAGQNG